MAPLAARLGRDAGCPSHRGQSLIWLETPPLPGMFHVKLPLAAVHEFVVCAALYAS